MGTLIFAWTVVKAILGISFVIFWHELGHFLLAKWNGVYVKTFSIGFPPRLVRLFRYKETDYVIGSIPLGGYVHMLGEDEGMTEPAPGAPAVADAEGQPRADVEPALANHPGAFFNKSVWARMAIISAGVVMNVILGLILFTAVYMMGGKMQMPAVVGAVGAGGPAYEAGLRPGDRIDAIDGKPNLTFQDMTEIVTHSGPGQELAFTVRRPGVDEPITLAVRPRRDAQMHMPMINVGNPASLELAAPAAFAPPPGMEGEPSGRFREGDRIVAAGPAGEAPAPVDSAVALSRLLDRHRDRAVTLVLEHSNSPGAGGTPADDDARPAELTLPPVRFVDFGFRVEPGPVVAVRSGSPAEAAGIGPGDTIVAVDDDRAYDPMRLPALAAGKVGEPVTLTLARGGKERSVVVEPVEGESWSPVIRDDSPLNVDAIGLTMEVGARVAGVRPNSPASRAGVKPGDTIASVRFTWPEPAASDETPGTPPEPREPTTLPVGEEVSWVTVFDVAQREPARSIEFTFDGRSPAVTIDPEPAEGAWYFPGRGLPLMADRAPLPPMEPADALRRAGDETLEAIGSFYTLLNRLRQGQVGVSALSGPVGIVGAAFNLASLDLVEFLWFIGFISLNLAVVNFLPIPPLDGGRMVFLIGEAVRGRPLPESWQALPMYVGLLFLLTLIAFLTVKDTLRFF